MYGDERETTGDWLLSQEGLGFWTPALREGSRRCPAPEGASEWLAPPSGDFPGLLPYRITPRGPTLAGPRPFPDLFALYPLSYPPRSPPLPPLYSPFARPCHPNSATLHAGGAVGGSARRSCWARACAGSVGGPACPLPPEIFSFCSSLPHFREFGMGGWGEWVDGGAVLL